MAERGRPATPLGFAIASSLAVLPVLLGIVWLVAVVRPAGTEAAHAERHSDPRRVAALRTFEPAIVARAEPTTTPARQQGGAARDARTAASLDAPSTAPTAADVLAGVAACRAAWGAPTDGFGWRSVFVAASAATSASAPAERIAAQLARIDATLRRFSSRANAAVDRPVGLDAARWFDAAAAGLRAQAFGCDDLAAAVAGIARSGEATLETWAWRGRTAPLARADWAPGQQASIAPAQAARANPWAGVAGCVVFGAVEPHAVAAPGGLAARLCEHDARSQADPSTAGVVAALAPSPDEPPGSARWGVPPSLDAMLAPLDGWRKPASARTGRRASLDGVPIALGRPVVLTIDPALQALAQKTAACYTGRHDVCRDLGLARTSDAGRAPGTGLLEGALVRMAAVAVIDVPSGRIEALAGARTPCARQEVDGPGRDASCDARLPWPVRWRPDALLNPAVFHDAMPASTVKPVLAATLLADGESGRRLLAAERAGAAREKGGAPARDSLRGELVRSESARFLDRLFCADRAFASDCGRPWQVAAQARAFGWNAGCDVAADAGVGPGGRPAAVRAESGAGDVPAGRSAAVRAVSGAGDAAVGVSQGRSGGAVKGDCGRRDLLSGAGPDGTVALPAGSARRPVSFGRLMTEPRGDGLGPFAPMRLDTDRVARCATGADGRRGSDDDWEKCRGGRLVDVVAEGWGQGHARASALGVAGMMAALASAADGRAAPPPHLVRAGPWDEAALDRGPSPAIPREAAEVVLQALAWTHRAGTARSACAEVVGAARCRTLEGFAGKTGTPSFPGDGLTLDAIAALCRDGAGAVAAAARPTAAEADRTERRRRACGPLRPDKWFVAAWREGGAADAPWSKAIAVLVERNWSASTGLVQGAGDHGPNTAAEIALQIAGRQLGWLPAAPPAIAAAVHARATADGSTARNAR